MIMSAIRKTMILLVGVATLLAVLPAGAAVTGASRILVCLDPGHGGTDSGATGNGLLEKDLNLDIALKARPLIESAGYAVLMTRETDNYVSLADRCAIANRAGAAIFVSIHNNAFESSSQGTETYCYYESAEGGRLATCIHTEVVGRTGRKDRGVKEAGFYVLDNTVMPAALLEGAFITNEKDAKCLADPKFRGKIAEGVAAGVADYLVDPGRFDEYILLMNPDGERSAEVSVEFMTGDGRQTGDNVLVPPGARYTMHVDEHVHNADVSAVVRSQNGLPVVAERSMYFDFEGGRGGHNALGVTATSNRWCLAEGSTSWGFSTFVLIENPAEEKNTAVVHFMRSDGVHKRVRYTLAPRSRFTLDASRVPGFEKADFSVEVTADQPVVVERAMYWNDYRGSDGGHASPGVTEPGRTWYVAEGYTGKGFDTFVLIGNPGSRAAFVHATYMLPDGTALKGYYEVPPYSRRSVHLNEVEGLSGTDVSARIDSSVPVVVERSMYFDYLGVRGGSNSTAVRAPADSWYLAEGYTGGGFDTFVLLMNPGAEDAEASLQLMMPGGRRREIGVLVPKGSRQTVHLDEIEGLASAEVSTRVTSDRPLVVERSMYFKLGERSDGHSSAGAPAPALEWYFAEGCTR